MIGGTSVLLLLLALEPLVAQNVEFRGMFVATVDNIDWPESPYETAGGQREQLDDILSVAERLNLNAIVLQVRERKVTILVFVSRERFRFVPQRTPSTHLLLSLGVVG